MSQSINPFAPPTRDVGAVPESSDDVLPVSAGTRFAHMVLDTIGTYLLMFFLIMCSALTELDGLAVLAVFAGTFYHLLFEATLGRTPAKFLTGTYVVTVDGRRPRFLQILGRSLARFVPFEPFSFLGNSGVGWHDSWSGTRVVKQPPRA